MIVRTLPREIAARWINAGDEVAMYEVEDGTGELDSGKRDFCRTVDYVERSASVDWWLVVDGTNLVRPPLDAEIGTTLEGTIRHKLRGQFDVEPGDRGFVPDDLDHTGAQAFIMVPIVENRVGMPRCYWARDSEQFVIRERVQISALDLMMDDARGSVAADAGALRLLLTEEPAEGQRVSAGTTVAERAPLPVRLLSVGGTPDTAIVTHLGTWLGERGSLPLWRCAKREEHDAHPWSDDKHCGPGASYWCHGDADNGPVGCGDDCEPPSSPMRPVGEITEQLPTRRIPLGVMGASLGRQVAESAEVNFRSERDSDES